MSAQFVTPSLQGTMLIKQEPLETEYQTIATPPTPLSSVPSPVQLPLMIKYGRMDSTRSRVYDKQHSCCEVCQGEFTDQELLLQHKLLHFNTSHVCYICDCYFMNTSTLIMHIATNHRNLNPAMVGRNDPDRSFVCSICLQRFSSNKTLTRHQETHKQHDENSFSCKICGLDFIGYRALVPHLNAARHKEMKIKIQSIFVCVDCRSVFPSRDSYAMHMMMRAQSETCSNKCAMPTNTAQIQKAYNYLPTTNGWNLNCGTDTASGSQHSDSARSDSVPLNLSLGQNSISPVSQSSRYKMLTCCKCGETVPDEESLALHLMVHVREESDQSYFSRFNYQQAAKSHSPVAQYTSQHELRIKRSDSAPVYDNITSGSDVDATVWTCHWCVKTFKTCDLLAMHMLEHQSQTQAEDKVNNNRKASPLANNMASEILDEVADVGDDVEKDDEVSVGKVQTSNESPAKENIRRQLIPGETCFSERSTPVSFKRSLVMTDIDEIQAKRCKSVGSSLLACQYCDKQFLSKDEISSHVVDEHGLSLKHLHCLICNSAFSQLHSLKCHLQTTHHRDMLKVKISACQSCEFMASSEAQIVQHEELHGIQRQIRFNTTQETPSMIADLLANRLVEEVEEHSNTSDILGDQDVTECSALVIDEKADYENSAIETNVQEVSTQSSETKTLSQNSPTIDTTQPTVSSASKRSKRKSRMAAKFIPGMQSPAVSENETWMEETLNGTGQMYGTSARQISMSLLSHGMTLPVATNMNMLASTPNTTSLWPGTESGKYKSPTRNSTYSESFQRPSATTGSANMKTSNNDDDSDIDLIDYVLSNTDKLCMCKYCKIIYTDQTMYYLHMGLHNLNNPWQCNLCGKANRNLHEFTSHVIHY